MHFPLPDFSACRVLVCGDVMLDRYWHGATARISPGASCQWSPSQRRYPGRQGPEQRNAASWALSTGDRAGGRGQGRPPAGRAACCRGASPVPSTKVSDAPTITKLRVISAISNLIRLDFEALRRPHGARVAAALEAHLDGVV